MIPRALLRCAASPGTGPVLASLLASELSRAEHALADALGCLVPAEPSRVWPCDDDGPGCPRVVRDDPRHALPLVAVCGREDGACEPVRLTHAQVARVRFDAAPLVRAIASLLGVAGAELVTIGADVLTLLGPETRAGRARDVVFAPDPHDPSLPHALAARAGAARPTLALTPMRGAPPLHERFAAGGHVELACLEDLVVLDGGTLRLAGPAPEPTRRTSPERPAVPRPASWSELRIYRIDGHTISARAHGSTARLTYLDLGMASARTREPTKTWALLMALCEGAGTFRWKDQGAHATVKQRVAVLRKELSAVFRLDDDPFEPFSLREGWRARFVARDGDGESLSGTRRNAEARLVPPDRSPAVPPPSAPAVATTTSAVGHRSPCAHGPFASDPPNVAPAVATTTPAVGHRSPCAHGPFASGPPNVAPAVATTTSAVGHRSPCTPGPLVSGPPPSTQRSRPRRQRSGTARAVPPDRGPSGPGPLARGPHPRPPPWHAGEGVR